MIKRIDHIGVAVKDLRETIKFLEVLGLKPAKELKMQKMKFAFIPVGDGEIELIEPTDPGISIAKFILEKGEGIHHIAMQVEEIEQVMEKLKEKGIKLIDEKPRVGAHGVKIAFIDPKSANGMLIELCEGNHK
jgi:lactoylglutathione lyase/methylmalonyl-CoA/ethylmalonyl-CoA epimerase